jgi:hypothetical protein
MSRLTWLLWGCVAGGAAGVALFGVLGLVCDGYFRAVLDLWDVPSIYPMLLVYGGGEGLCVGLFAHVCTLVLEGWRPLAFTRAVSLIRRELLFVLVGLGFGVFAATYNLIHYSLPKPWSEPLTWAERLQIYRCHIVEDMIPGVLAAVVVRLGVLVFLSMPKSGKTPFKRHV